MKNRCLLALVALVFLAGCGPAPSNVPVQPKWKGAPYRLAFGTPPAKPNRTGITIPPIKYTANPDALETRANLVIQFDNSGAKKPGADEIIMVPTDISGAEGTLPADYVDAAGKGLAQELGAYCVNGKVKIAVALVRSSISLTSSDDEVNDKRLSDWLPMTIDFKNPHPKC